MTCPICQGRGKVFEGDDIDLCSYCGGSGQDEGAKMAAIARQITLPAFLELKAIIELRKSNPTMLAILGNMA